MEQIKNINVDVASFIKNLNNYTKTVKELDHETINLLDEAIYAINELKNGSKFHGSSYPDLNSFVSNLDDEIFECRRYSYAAYAIIPLNYGDFECHIQKENHKQMEINLRSKRIQNVTGCNIYYSLPKKVRLSNGSMENVKSSRHSSQESDCSYSVLSCEDTSQSTSASQSSIELASQSSNISQKLEDLIDIEKISEVITSGMIDITSRTESRIRDELNILSVLNQYLKVFGSTLKIIPIGSSNYGFGGKTDFNILVQTAEDSMVTLQSVEELLKKRDVQTEFNVIGTINCDRVLNGRLQLIHKQSQIMCSIHFSSNFEMAESTQIIRDAIAYEPLCLHLIAYIRSWQDALNEIATQNAVPAFEFNTYIISVLVIFFLQNNRSLNELPKLTKLPPTESEWINEVDVVEQHLLIQAAHQFFEFYGKKYQPNNHLISLNIGRWQQRYLDYRQQLRNKLSPEQKSLRDAIESHSYNWENCWMYVQDIKSPETNIAAEISREEANNFQRMCRMFCSVVEVAGKNNSKLTKIERFSVETSATKLSFMNQNLQLAESPLQCLNLAADRPNNLNLADFGSSNWTNRTLIDVIKIEDLARKINFEMNQLLSRSNERTSNEHEIVDMLSFYFEARHSIRSIHSIQCVRSSFIINTDHFHYNATSYTIGKPLTGFVRAWQIVLSEVAAKNQVDVFHFNTYIISVLVIFYFQMNHNLDHKNDLGYFIKDFFHFYGKSFDTNTHIISVRIGKWQKIDEPDQENFTPEQKSLSDCKRNYPENWENCSMYVQDPILPWKNITVGTSKSEVDCFIQMCQLYANYFAAVDIACLNSSWSESSSIPSTSTCSISSGEFSSTTIAAVPAVTKHPDFNRVFNVFTGQDPVVRMIDQILEDVLRSASDQSKLQTRKCFEFEIFSLLSQFTRIFDSTLQVYACGSTQYIGMYDNMPSRSNFNLLINIVGRKSVPHRFISKYDRTKSKNEFKCWNKLHPNRVICTQIEMVHIKSDIPCSILFATDDSILKSTVILGRFTRDPLCKFLITYVKVWQTVLNRLGIARFNFNSYIISVLVIFFLQMELCFPTVDQLLTSNAEISSNVLDFKPILRQLFHFYGHRYEIRNHIISINIGHWQERCQPVEQIVLTPAQKRLREGIATFP